MSDETTLMTQDTCHNTKHRCVRGSPMHMECQSTEATNKMIDCSEHLSHETATNHTASVYNNDQTDCQYNAQ